MCTRLLCNILASLCILAIVGKNASPKREKVDRNHILITVEWNNELKNYTLNWTRILTIINNVTVRTLWEMSNVTESLSDTYNKFKDFHKPGNEVVIRSGSGYKEQSVDPKQKNISVGGEISQTSIGNDYDGKYGIPSQNLFDSLFKNSMDVFPNKNVSADVFYPFRDRANYVSLKISDATEFVGVFTVDYAYIIFLQEVNSTKYDMTLLLGNTAHLPVLKGSLDHLNFTVAKNDEQSMLLYVKTEDKEKISHIFKPNYTNMFIEATETPLFDLLGDLQDYAVSIEATGHCKAPHLTGTYVEFFFKVLVAFHRTGRELRRRGNGNICFRWLIEHAYELEILTDLIKGCHRSFYMSGFSTLLLERIAAAVIVNLPINSLSSLNKMDQDWSLKLIYYGHNMTNVLENSWGGIASVMLGVYRTYTQNFDLTINDRQTLFYVYEDLRFDEIGNRTINDHNLRIIYAAATSMCSSLELATMVSFWAKPKGHSHKLHASFSPCFMSLRFDFSKDKLYSQSFQTSSITKKETLFGVDGFFNVIHGEHLNNSFHRLLVYDCITATDKVRMVVSLKTYTYIISVGPASKGTMYEVKNTFINNKLIITSIDSNANCSSLKTTNNQKYKRIPVVYNITKPWRQCVLCQSAVLSYDEHDGIQSVVYVTDISVQNRVFDENNLFFSSKSLHVHYLILMNNGTIVRVRGVYVREFRQLLISTAFFCGFCAFVWIIYRIVGSRFRVK
ncbi:gH [Phascolarctid gammaherpesvirus 1]|uniref:GH n=1 Tax=Phascolarctid gammaherpesvirus 1 TaxID=2249313 RepID=A0A3S5HA14_9GAMA|nr:gH [Phascolarctid gammaherpesvirus 1]AZB49195.1 gH [Phascolarctid gammaherpesvirus 1]